MGMSGCYLVMKYLLVVLNCFFLVTGWAISGVSIWFLAGPGQLSAAATAGSSRYQTGLYVILASGLILATVAFVGLCGALRGSRRALSAFFCLLTLLVVGEAAAAWWGAAHARELRSQIDEYVKGTVAKEYGQVESVTAALDTLQSQLMCCGADGPGDYMVSRYGTLGDGGAPGVLDLSLLSGRKEYLVPASCCARAATPAECNAARSVPLTAPVDSPHLYRTGCVNSIVSYTSRYAPIAAAVAVAALSLQVLSLLLSVCLCINSSRDERYKA